MTSTPTLDPDKFAAEFRRLLDMVGKDAQTVADKVLLQIGERLVMKSPVGDPTYWKNPAPPGYVGGRFRANWQHGFNLRPSGVIDAVDAAGQDTVARLAQQVRNVQGHAGTHFFVNNLPYANRLEYGHSKQAPIGMVGVTALEFYDYVEQAAAHVKNRKATGATP